MSDATLKRLVGALVITLAVWGVASFLTGRGGPIGATGDITRFFEGMDSAAVSAVRFVAPGEETVELASAENGWTVNGHASDPLMVSRLLSAFERAGSGELAGTNPDNHDRIGVSADSAVAMEVDIAGETRTLLIGKPGARGGTVYARLPGEDEAYLIEADVRAPAVRRLEDWRNKRMVEADTSRVHRVEVEREGDAYTLVRSEDVWALESGEEASSTTVRSLLSELARLTASGFLEEADSVAMLERGGSTVAYSDLGEVLAEVTIGTGENDRWVRVPDDPALYRLPAFRIDRLVPTRESVLPDS